MCNWLSKVKDMTLGPVSSLAPSHQVEQTRLAALYRYNILDTAPEPQFDRLVALASRHFNMPLVSITFVDEHRQWFKACLGLEHAQEPRSESFCAVTIAREGVMVVPDLHLDPSLHSYPSVTASPYMRFYAGAPIITPEGDKLGTFCVLDQQPRTFGPQEIEDLEVEVANLKKELRRKEDEMNVDVSDDPRMNMNLNETQDLIAEQRRKTKEVERATHLSIHCSL